jgi:hypothetical protein
MKKNALRKIAIGFALLLSASAVHAYSADDTKPICKKPRFTDFSLVQYKEPEKLEVAPESEFFFKISVWSNPETLTLTAKSQPLPFKVESTTTFHKITAKLPPEVTGQFVRFNANVKSVLGCDESIGWLIKVADKK